MAVQIWVGPDQVLCTLPQTPGGMALSVVVVPFTGQTGHLNIRNSGTLTGTTMCKSVTTSPTSHQIPRSTINVSWSYVSTGTLRRCMIRTSMTMIKCRLAFCHLLISNLSTSALYGGESHRPIVLRAFWISSSTCTNATRCPWTACQKHLEE